MKIEKRTYDYKKHIIHVLVAGAMAISWGTVSHVHDFMQKNLRGPSSRSRVSKTTPEEFTSTTSEETAGPHPPPFQPVRAEKPLTPPVKTVETKKVAQVKEPVAAQVTKKVKISTESMISAVAAETGVQVKGVSITQTKIDTSFIRKVEGSLLKGYVPLAGTSKSGVTVADGFDLGQMHLREFNSLSITPALKAKLAPYVGMKGMEAKRYVQKHPLTITPAELKQLNIIAANKILQPLVKTYDKASGTSFLSLPAKAQTAIFSYAYQNGPGFMKRQSGKQLWHCFITQNWSKASSSLKSFRMYASRRIQEAHLLDAINA